MLLLFSVSVLGLFCPSSGDNAPLHAYSPGDIIIGGLFSVHRKTTRSSTTDGPASCTAYDVQSFLHTQVMIYAIREINQRPPWLLPNFTIGYDIYDTCGDVSFALRATLQLLRNQSDPQMCLVPESIQSALPDPKTKAVVGGRYSEVSIAVARVLTLSSVAQISYASTSEQLSNKLNFPSFLRTISSDQHQTKAIAGLVKMFNFKTVAIIGSDDGYGKYGSDQLVDIFSGMKDLCIEFLDILPGYFSQNSTRLDELVRNINRSSAEAIIVFTKGTNVEVIMEAAIKNNLNRTWIASDSWSTSTKISALPGIEMAGEVFGFISKKNEVPSFKDYVMSMFNGTTNAFLEHYLTQYPLCVNKSEEESSCSGAKGQQGSKRCLDLSCLASYIDQDWSHNIYLAVQVICEGLRSLLKCDKHPCKHSRRFSASELLTEIKKVNFSVDTTHIYFDASGNPSLGYDVVYWNMDEPNRTHIETIGEYWPNGELKIPADLVRIKASVTVTVYNCSKRCEPGHELKKQSDRCCRGCFPCADGEFSPDGGEECKRCRPEAYSSPQRNECLNRTVEFLHWSDSFVIILTCLEIFGIIVTTVFAVVFTIYRSTPIVKAVGGYLCFLELFSLLACFCVAFCFTGRPTKVSCMVGLPVFGVAFSLCVSCILANLLQILVGFNFDQKIGSWIKTVNRPLAVVTTVSGIQLALCVPWLYLDPPLPNQMISNKKILLQCDKGSIAFFVAMLGYNAFLALSCFLFAFKGRQLPDLYKNARLVSTSMLLFLIIWILFIPIYISFTGKYTRAIESAAILISSYSILGFHLAPKCYIMVFRREINNENAIIEHIRKHYEQKNMAVVKS